MTEQPIEPQESPARLRNTDAILLALGETRAAAQQAAQTASRVEQSVSGLATRVGALEVDVAAVKAQLTAREESDRARREEERSEQATKTPPATWIALVVAVAAVIVPLLIDAYHS